MNVKQIGKNIIQESVHIDTIGELIIGSNSVVSHEACIEIHEHDFDSGNWVYEDASHVLVIEGQVYIGVRAVI